MHIPENYLSPQTCAVMGAAMVPVWAYCGKKIKKDPKTLSTAGAAGAFSFLVMMLNIPVPGGTTAHAVCGTLAAVLLGPEAACIAVSIALVLQALLFGDGGVLAIGANCFNIAFVLPFAGYGIYNLLRKYMKPSLAAGIGAYIGINCAAFCTALMFGLQPVLFTDAHGAPLYCPYNLGIAIPGMMLAHLTIAGAAEALITAAAAAYLTKNSDEHLPVTASEKVSIGVLLFMIIISPLGLLAAGDAWGEWGIDALPGLNIIPAGMKHGWEMKTLIPDYSMAGLPEWFGYILSAVIGAAVMILVFRILAALSHKEAA